MYGFFSSALEKLVRRRFGDDKWEEICELAGVSLGDSCSFQVHHLYEEKDIQSLLKASSTVLGLDQGSVLEMFGEQFLQWCMEYGQSETLRLLGRSLQDFLVNLDSLHDHVSTIYPQMTAPSFRCSPSPRSNEFFLHYHSQREGLEPLVEGLVKAIARQYFNMEVEVRLVTKKGEEGSDHSVFTVQEVASYEDSQAEVALRCSTPRGFSEQQLVSPETFCKSFPFHIIFNRNLEILQCGSTLSVLLSGVLQNDSNISSHFKIDHPLIRFSFDCIISHINTFFVLRMTSQVSSSTMKFVMRKDVVPLSLRGQMVYLRESDSLLFLCSPRVKQLSDLERAGLYLSDIPLHDATRGLLMIGQAAESEFINSVHLEELILELQAVQKSLEVEKQRMAGLLREMLPCSVADRLMAGQTVEAERFENVSILFSDIVEFTSICSRSEPMEIVNMLNKLYSCFDQCVDQNQVYKVETIGDAYMVVAGLPQSNTSHAECVANQALDMMYYCRRVSRPDNGNPISMRVGIHSGKVVAGIVGVRMPRYCLFGNTVNIASRAESGGVPGRIQVTEYTYNLLKHNPLFSFTYRGPMEFKNVPEPIPCYFLLENSAKSKPTPVTVPFSEDLVPGYDLCTRPTPFLSLRSRRVTPPPSPATKFSSLLTVPALSQVDPDVPTIIPPKRPLSCSSASSSSTLQSRGEDSVSVATIPDIAIADDVDSHQLVVPVPDISVTAATSSSSISRGGGVSERCGKQGGTRILLRGRSWDDAGSMSDRSVTPESPFYSAPPLSLTHSASTTSSVSFSASEPYQSQQLRVSPPAAVGHSTFIRGSFGRESIRLGQAAAQEIRRANRESLSAMSPLKEETGEDSVYSSFEGSEISDQETERGWRRLERRREGRAQHRERRGGRESRRKGQTEQPWLLTVRGRTSVDIGEEVGEDASDGVDDQETSSSSPVRKISDCSNRSVDSGTKMSEFSKDDDEFSHRKLSDLSEASQIDFEVEEERDRLIRKSESPLPSSPPLSPARFYQRRSSVLNKIDFFNQWIQQHQLSPPPGPAAGHHSSGERRSGGGGGRRRRTLMRTQSETIFSNLQPNTPQKKKITSFY